MSDICVIHMCVYCPFVSVRGSGGGHGDPGGYDYKCSRGVVFPGNGYSVPAPETPPDDCPLREGPITVLFEPAK